MARRKLVAGNWKMNGLAASAAMLDELAAAQPAPACDVLICPPATLARPPRRRPLPGRRPGLPPGASGAHTGDIAAEMLADAGAVAVIVGHSERRADHGETDALVRAKAEAAWRAGLTRRSSASARPRPSATPAATLDRVASQLAGSIPDGATADRLVVAYEPVWAIGTGRTPTLAEIAEVHGFMRERLAARFGAAVGRRRPAALRRLGQARQRRRDLRRRRRRRRAGRRRLAQGRRLRPDHRRRRLTPCRRRRRATVRAGSEE